MAAPAARPFRYEVYLIRISRSDRDGRGAPPKYYVGQTQTHVLNHGKYRPFGTRRRLAAHISEAFRHREKECRKLNDAIRHYGAEALCARVLRVVDTAEEADAAETHFIKVFDAIEHGYNVRLGGRAPPLTDAQKQSVSSGLRRHYSKKEAREAHGRAHIRDDAKLAAFTGEAVARLVHKKFYEWNGVRLILFHAHTTSGKCIPLRFSSKHQSFHTLVERANAVLRRLAQTHALPRHIEMTDKQRRSIEAALRDSSETAKLREPP